MLGYLDEVRDGRVHGWAADPARPDARLAVTIMVDGVPVGSTIADLPREDLKEAGLGDGHHAFRFPLPDEWLDGRVHHVAVVFAGTGEPLTHSPLAAPLTPRRAAVFEPVGAARRPADPAAATVALAAIVRDEGPYIAEWIAYHRLIGFDHFLIYDHGSRDGTGATLKRLARRGLVTRVDWRGDGPNPQLAAYQHALEGPGRGFDWLAFLDADEFLVLHRDARVRTFLARFAEAAAVAVNWRMFGSGGQRERGDGLVMERFTRCAATANPVNRIVKSIVRPSCAARAGIHLPELAEGSIVDERHGLVVDEDGGRHAHVGHALCQINHYFTKSYAEWTAKRLRGKADRPAGDPARLRPDEEFAIYDFDEESDDSILRHADATRQMMADLLKGAEED